MPASRRDTVLLVGHDLAQVGKTQSYLVARGLRVVTSASSEGLGSLIEDYRPAVAVLDPSMPGLDRSHVEKLLRSPELERSAVMFYSDEDLRGRGTERLYSEIERHLAAG